MADDAPIQVVVNALEDAGFKGTWDYPAGSTALEAAIQTAEIVVVALTEAGFLAPEATS